MSVIESKYHISREKMTFLSGVCRILQRVKCVVTLVAMLLSMMFSVGVNAQRDNKLLQEVFFQSVDSVRVSMLKIDMTNARRWMDLALMSICDSDTYHTYKLLDFNMTMMRQMSPAQKSMIEEMGNYFLDRTDTVACYAQGCYWYTLASCSIFENTENAEMYYTKAEDLLRSGGFNSFANQCQLFKTEALIRAYKYAEAASLARSLLDKEQGVLAREMRYFSLLQLYKIYTQMHIMPMVEYYGRLIEREGFYAESLRYELRYLQRKICYLIYLNDADEAFPLCKRLTQIAELLKIEGGEWNSNLLYARLLVMDKQYAEATRCIQKCYELYEEVKSSLLYDPYFSKEHLKLIHSMLKVAKGDADGALELLSSIDDNSPVFGVYDIVTEYYHCKEQCYNLKGDYDNAIINLERKDMYSDSIVADHTRQRSNDLEAMYRDDSTILGHKAQLMEQEVALLNLRMKLVIGISLLIVFTLAYYAFRIAYRRREKVRKAQLSKEMNIFLEQEVARQTEELLRQSALIRSRNNDIMLSQLYAQRIQHGILPPLDKVKFDGIANSFVIFSPIETVSGDFYWYDKVGDKIVICCADSSGHGVPGAMMSMVGMTLVSEVVRRKPNSDSSELMNTINDDLLRMMPDLSWLDGINMSLVVIDTAKKVLDITLARHNTLYFSLGEADYIRGTKRRVGDRLKPVCDRKFQMFRIEYEHGDSLYLYTDGITELFGGKNAEKLKITGFRKLLEKADKEPVEKREQLIKDGIKDWCGELAQNDDILIIGLQL